MVSLPTVNVVDTDKILKKSGAFMSDSEKTQLKRGGAMSQDAASQVDGAQDEVSYGESVENEGTKEEQNGENQGMTADNAGGAAEGTKAQSEQDLSFLDDADSFMSDTESVTTSNSEEVGACNEEVSAIQESSASESEALAAENTSLIAQLTAEASNGGTKSAQAQGGASDGFGGIVGANFDGTGEGVRSAYSLSIPVTQKESSPASEGDEEGGIINPKSAPAPQPQAPAPQAPAPQAPAPQAGGNNGGGAPASNNVAQYMSQIEANSAKMTEINQRTIDAINAGTAQLEGKIAETEARLAETSVYSEKQQQIKDNCAIAGQVINTVSTIGGITNTVGTATVVAGGVMMSVGSGVTSLGGILTTVGATLSAVGTPLIPVFGSGTPVVAAGAVTGTAGGTTTGTGTGLTTAGVTTANIGSNVMAVGNLITVGAEVASVVNSSVSVAVDIQAGVTDGLFDSLTQIATEGLNVAAKFVPGGGIAAKAIEGAKASVSVAQGIKATVEAAEDGDVKGAIKSGLGALASTASAASNFGGAAGAGKGFTNAMSYVKDGSQAINSGISTYEAIEEGNVSDAITNGLSALSSVASGFNTATANGSTDDDGNAKTGNKVVAVAKNVIDGAKLANTVVSKGVAYANSGEELDFATIAGDVMSVANEAITFANSVKDTKNTHFKKAGTPNDNDNTDVNKKEVELTTSMDVRIENAKAEAQNEIDELEKALSNVPESPDLRMGLEQEDMNGYNDLMEGYNDFMDTQLKAAKEKLDKSDEGTWLESVNKRGDGKSTKSNLDTALKLVQDGLKAYNEVLKLEGDLKEGGAIDQLKEQQKAEKEARNELKETLRQEIKDLRKLIQQRQRVATIIGQQPDMSELREKMKDLMKQYRAARV